MKSAFVLMALLAATGGAARAHQTLSEAVEVNLHDPALIRVEFTIHAPELPTPLAAGIDPASVDPGWLPGRSDDEIAQLKLEGTAFIRRNFLLGFPGGPNLLDSAAMTFDPAEAIRHPPADTKLPPGCLLATVTLVNPGPPDNLRIGFAEGAQKRLLLSISRPGAFPEVRDLAPGESFEAALPEPPPRPPSSRGPVLAILGALAVTLAAWLAGRRFFSR